MHIVYNIQAGLWPASSSLLQEVLARREQKRITHDLRDDCVKSDIKTARQTAQTINRSR